jgi:hypothetical protein
MRPPRPAACSPTRAAARRRAAGVGALAALAVAAAACSGDATGPEPIFTGNYRLISVGGSDLPQPLPARCPPLGACTYMHSGRIEVMSRGRIRDILEYRAGPPPWRTIVDTVISAYLIEGRQVIVHRTVFGGSFHGAHSDTGEMDPQGRLLIVPKVVGMGPNSALFFYAPEQAPPH